VCVWGHLRELVCAVGQVGVVEREAQRVHLAHALVVVERQQRGPSNKACMVSKCASQQAVAKGKAIQPRRGLCSDSRTQGGGRWV
jgi:hypothetical protein